MSKFYGTLYAGNFGVMSEAHAHPDAVVLFVADTFEEALRLNAGNLSGEFWGNGNATLYPTQRKFYVDPMAPADREGRKALFVSNAVPPITVH